MPPPKGPPCVLVVDDDQANLDTFRRVFRKDFTLELADSGRAALEVVKSRDLDVVLTDFAMPEMNGVEFLRQARLLKPDLCRIMVTAHADLSEVVEANAAGLSAAVVMKPWERDDLLRLVTGFHRMAEVKRSLRAFGGRA